MLAVNDYYYSVLVHQLSCKQRDLWGRSFLINFDGRVLFHLNIFVFNRAKRRAYYAHWRSAKKSKISLQGLGQFSRWGGRRRLQAVQLHWVASILYILIPSRAEVTTAHVMNEDDENLQRRKTNFCQKRNNENFAHSCHLYRQLSTVDDIVTASSIRFPPF